MPDTLSDRLTRANLDLGYAELTVLSPGETGSRYGVPSDIRLVEQAPDADGAFPVPRLEWAWSDTCWSPPVTQCLDRFIRLTDAPPAAILGFARTWGPLGICRHAKPAGHSRCQPLTMPGAWWEPLEPWYRYSRQLRAILGVAADLHAGHQIDPAELDAIASAEPGRDDTLPDHAVAGVVEGFDTLRTIEAWSNQKRFRMKHLAPDRRREYRMLRLGRDVDTWLRYGKVAPAHVSTSVGLRVKLSFAGLAGALAVQLSAALTSPLGVSRCGSETCRMPYALEYGSRKPQRGRKHYCPRCREGNLAAKRAWWHANRSKPKQGNERGSDGEASEQ